MRYAKHRYSNGWVLASVAGWFCVSLLGAAAQDAAWQTAPVPGRWDEPGYAWYRCWVKVPDHWTVMTGRPLFRESVTFSIRQVAEVHEVFVNRARIGGAGNFPPDFERKVEGTNRYKVPPGSLVKGQWNEVAVRVYHKEGKGGFLHEAPSIQGYFLECVLEGSWEFRRGDGEDIAGEARAEKPPRAAFDQFKEASRILGEAGELMPGPRLPPAESLALMKPEGDLVIEELLAEPLVAQPTHLSFDDRGRLWVAQYRQYPYPAGLKQISRDKYYRAKYDREPKAPPHHNRGRSRISVHEDSDGDGKFDRHKVFLDGLDLANAALPDHDGVWVMHTPYLLFYPDRNRDDVPDGDPEVHLAGFGFEDTHSVANGLVWGPDGWIYGGQGSTVASRVVRPGLDGGDAPGVYFEGCMAWRYEPKERRFEIFAEGGGNVFGLEFDSEGRLFSGHNGGNTRGWHYVQGGYLLKQGRTPSKFGPPVNPYAFGDLPMMRSKNDIPRFSHNTILCEGTAMPTRMQGRFLAADPLHHFLVLSERTPRGSTFETADLGHPLVSEDEAFRPVYLCNAPDGSIYVADFYEHYIAHGQHYQSQIDPSTGRVYRLRGKGNELRRDTDLSTLDTNALVALLGHPNRWQRRTAVRLLGERGKEKGLREKLAGWVRDHEGRAALDGLWALYRVGGLNEEVAAGTLRHPYPAVRAWTIRLLGDGGKISKGTAEAIRELAKTEKDLEVWSQIASTVQRLPAAQALPILGEVLARSGDLDDPNLPLMFWWAIEKHCDSGREAVLVTMKDRRLWMQPTVIREILPRLMRRFALQGRETDLLVCAELLRLAPDEDQRTRLMEGFEQAFEGGALPALPGELRAALGETGRMSLVLRVRQGKKAALKEAIGVVGDPKAKGVERLRLIKAFGEIAQEETREVLVQMVHAEKESAVRKAALAALQGFSAPEVADAILEAYPSLTVDERVAAEALLASRVTWSRSWLAAIEAGTLKAEGVAPEAVATLRRHPDGQLATLVKKHFGAEAGPGRPTTERVAQVREIIAKAPGSPYRGRPLFKQRCAACHVLFYKGGRIGPDLTSYQRDDLGTMLTSILDPNAEIREGYEGFSVKTADGRLLTGFIADRGAQSIVVRQFDGSDVALPRNQVSEMTPLGRSLMPTGLLDGLSDQQVRDLFAYLRSAQPFLEP